MAHSHNLALARVTNSAFVHRSSGRSRDAAAPGGGDGSGRDHAAWQRRRHHLATHHLALRREYALQPPARRIHPPRCPLLPPARRVSRAVAAGTLHSRLQSHDAARLAGSRAFRPPAGSRATSTSGPALDVSVIGEARSRSAPAASSRRRCDSRSPRAPAARSSRQRSAALTVRFPATRVFLARTASWWRSVIRSRSPAMRRGLTTRMRDARTAARSSRSCGRGSSRSRSDRRCHGPPIETLTPRR
jgi:hypothetical protein